MISTQPYLTPSPLDSNRFGFRIARGTLAQVDERALLGELVDQSIDVAILRIPSGASAPLQKLGRYGIPPIHADTLVYYQVSLADHEPAPLRNRDLDFSVATDADRSELAALVLSTFHGYVSHYHANPLLQPEDILAGYAEWALDFISQRVPEQITWVARRGGAMVAFACCAEDSKNGTCEGILYGVHRDHSGGGLYGDLIRYTQARFRERRIPLMKVSTQIWNFAVQKVWGREGFHLFQAFDTFHVNALLSAGEPLVDRDVTFDAARVAAFAAATGDFNPIHLDDGEARKAGFEARISHGMLAGSEISKIFGTEIPGPGTLFLRSHLAFLHPVYSGRPHRLRIRYLGAVPLSGRVPAVATLHDEAGKLCVLVYNDLLKRD